MLNAKYLKISQEGIIYIDLVSKITYFNSAKALIVAMFILSHEVVEFNIFNEKVLYISYYRLYIPQHVLLLVHGLELLIRTHCSKSA